MSCILNVLLRKGGRGLTNKIKDDKKTPLLSFIVLLLCIVIFKQAHGPFSPSFVINIINLCIIISKQAHGRHSRPVLLLIPLLIYIIYIQAGTRTPFSLIKLNRKKARGVPVTMVTAYDYPSAKAASAAGADMLLVRAATVKLYIDEHVCIEARAFKRVTGIVLLVRCVLLYNLPHADPFRLSYADSARADHMRLARTPC